MDPSKPAGAKRKVEVAVVTETEVTASAIDSPRAPPSREASADKQPDQCRCAHQTAKQTVHGGPGSRWLAGRARLRSWRIGAEPSVCHSSVKRPPTLRYAFADDALSSCCTGGNVQLDKKFRSPPPSAMNQQQADPDNPERKGQQSNDHPSTDAARNSGANLSAEDDADSQGDRDRHETREVSM